MSLLFIIWLTSLLVVVGVPAFFLYRARHATLSFAYVPHDLADLISREAEYLAGRLTRAKTFLAPHAQKVNVVVVAWGSRGHNLFMDRVFGRVEAKKGKAVSFFLKHIAEYKETMEKEGRKML